MSRLAICARCGGRGVVWTGQREIPCTAPHCRDGRIVVR